MYDRLCLVASLKLIKLNGKCVFVQFLYERFISHENQHFSMKCAQCVRSRSFIAFALTKKNALLFLANATHEFSFYISYALQDNNRVPKTEEY